MSYYYEFISAVKRTEDWGFDPGQVYLDKSVSFLDKDSHLELLELFEWNYKGLSDEMRMDCTNVSLNMLGLVQKHFCTDAFLTTGDLYLDNKSYFECSLDYLETVARSKFNSKLKVHMWITLASGEIIDFTFLRTKAKFSSSYEPIKSQIVTSVSLEELKLVYFPMIIGSDFYKKTGSMISFYKNKLHTL